MAVSKCEDAFRIPYNMLILTGIWPKENSDITFRIRTLSSWFFALSLCINMLIELLHDIDNFTKLSETLYIMVTYMGFIAKLLVFSYREKEFLNIINFLKDPIFASYSEELDHYMKKTIRQLVCLASIYRACTLLLIFGYIIYPILDNKPLPFPLPYDLGKYTIMMYVLQIIGESFSAVNNISLDLICISLLGIVTAQLDILAETIIRSNQDDSLLGDTQILNEVNNSTIGKLKQCVKHHIGIIRSGLC
ncbi:hypothetical protein ILUMI_02060 [Ignelater luminosus]|uniref:Uncharacterized protein n=1 Tax=Ignelater luminosus TaxID=2038154 RepID=A0A8K0GJL9_IGNLU|nr:hypothetical protein ILUMI_02060 [Ignelater luminosus]